MADDSRHVDRDPEWARLLEGIGLRSSGPMPKPPADSLVTWRCDHGARSRPLGFIAMTVDGGFSVTVRDRLAGQRSWASYTASPAGLQDLWYHGIETHCGTHSIWLDGDDFRLPGSDETTPRVVVKRPSPPSDTL